MWAFLCMEHVRAVYHHVRRTQGRRGWKAPGVRGGRCSFWGGIVSWVAPDRHQICLFSHIQICVFLSHFVQFIFVDVNALV